MTLISIFWGLLIGGEFGIIFALNLLLISFFIIPKISAKTIRKLYKVKRLYESELPRVYENLELLAKRTKVTTPILYYAESSAIIVFSTGNRDDRAIITLQKIEYYEKNILEKFFIPWRILTEQSILRTHLSTKERVKRLIGLLQSEEFEIDSEKI